MMCMTMHDLKHPREHLNGVWRSAIGLIAKIREMAKKSSTSKKFSSGLKNPGLDHHGEKHEESSSGHPKMRTGEWDQAPTNRKPATQNHFHHLSFWTQELEQQLKVMNSPMEENSTLNAQFEGEKSGSCHGSAQFGERRGFDGGLMTNATASDMGVGGYFGDVGLDEVDNV